MIQLGHVSIATPTINIFRFDTRAADPRFRPCFVDSLRVKAHAEAESGMKIIKACIGN
jgi:hypothetical protein